MNIIPLIEYFTSTFNKLFNNNVNFLNLESKIVNVGDNFTLKLYEIYLNYIDLKFKNSIERKKIYNIKDTRKKTLITSIGTITINSTSYYKKDNKERFVLLRELLSLKPYQRLTNEAEYQLVKYAMSENMAQSARHALRNTIISRSTVSKKIAKLNGTIKEDISKSTNQPDVLYIEMDEIHANLQKGGNKICPCAIVHEGYEENFVKRKKIKNIHYFASSKLSYNELWEVIYNYVDKKYDIDKFKKIFISGDGAIGIKEYRNCFTNAIFVLDIFHYKRKHLQYIFKKDKFLKDIADEYIRNDDLNSFKTLVESQIKLHPEQEEKMWEHYNYIINNLDGIKNQYDEDYKTHCSMEGHVNHGFARYITSSPFGFSENGLENKIKLLVYNANKLDLTIEDFYNLKYGTNSYEDINKNIKDLCNMKYDTKILKNKKNDYDINTSIPLFDIFENNMNMKSILSFTKAKFYY